MPRRPLARLLTTLVALALLLSTALPALAQQDATPEASPTTPGASPTAAGSGPQVGDAVVLFTQNGKEEAQVAVTELTDPFTAAESEAQRGFHYVQAEIVVENLSDAAYEFNPYALTLVDDAGFAYQATFASRSAEDTAARPDFQANAIEPGQTSSGVLFFEVVDDAAVALVVLSDGFERFTVLVDQRPAAPAEGEAVSVYDNDGDEIGAVAVDRIVTGLEDTDPDVSVDRGQTAVAVVLTATNTGDLPLVSPGVNIRVVDEFGVASFPIFAFRSEESMAELPDFPTDDIAPGDSATGAVVFALPTDAVVTYVLYQPEFTRLTIVGQPGEGSVVSGDALEPVAVPTQASTDGEPVDAPTEVSVDDEPTETATGGETPVALTGDCGDLQAWVDATEETLAPVSDIQALNSDTPDAGQFREDAAALRDAADAQADVDTPEIAQGGQEALVAFLGAYADVLDDGADRLDAGDDMAAIFASFAEGDFADAVEAVDAATTALQTTCPDVDFGDLV